VIVNLAIIIGYAKYVAATFHAIVWGTVGALISSIAVLFFSEITFWLGNFNKKTLTRADQKQIFEYGLPLVPVLAISFIFQGMDKIALRAYSTLDEVGIYATATKFVFLLTIIQTTFYLFWAPVAFERYEKDRTDSRFFENMFKYMAAAVLLAGCALLLAKDVIVLLLAESYRGAVYIMPFLLIAPMMYILGDVAGIGIGLKKKTYFYIVVVAVGAIVNFTGNYFLIPIIGAKGAAVSTGIAYIVYFIIRTSIGTRLFPAKYPMARFLCGFLVIVGFMYLNTFHVVLWWYNVIPALITVMLYRSTIYEILRRKA
jgi:O-antigen/teichoic acid export membrane protein